MDEVDFTILAATSVLGDMIEKCPPAEACRDAFNRMSKATVQMCLSTTGFASSAQGLSTRTSRKAAEESTATPEFYSASGNQFATSNTRGHKAMNRQPTDHQQQLSRPKTKFDMGLNDLFPVNTTMKQPQPPQLPLTPTGPPSYNSTPSTHSIKADFGPDSYGIPRNQVHSPTDYALEAASGPLDTSAIDPSLLPSPQLQNHGLPLNPVQQYPNVGGMFGGGAYGDIDFNIQGMDFLQSYGQGMDAAQNSSGMDLGFGLGWEGMDHDFSEGNQLDLFDGFFFGNN